MNFDDSFPNRVAVARNAIGLTQDELAKKVGVVRRQIAAYEGGEARPRIRALQNLAAALGTTSEWLASGTGNGPDVSAVTKTSTVRELPVLSNLHAGAAELSGALDFSSVAEYIPAPLGAGERSFAIRIQGNSMESSSGLSFPEGSIVTFDPDLEPQNGDYVLCTINEFDTTFKQFVIDQKMPFLKPLNPAFSTIGLVNRPSILAVAIHVQNFIPRKSGEKNKDNLWDPVAPWWDREEVSYNFEAEIENKVESLEAKVDRILELLTRQTNT